ncbi:MAG: hypothetical protein ACKO5Q_10715, partial [Microcystaceae cyanobacterium]
PIPLLIVCGLNATLNLTRKNYGFQVRRGLGKNAKIVVDSPATLWPPQGIPAEIQAMNEIPR